MRSVLVLLGLVLAQVASSQQAQQAQMDEYVRQTAGSAGPTAEIENAKKLLDSGAITQAEFDQIKAKALA